jgi:integrase
MAFYYSGVLLSEDKMPLAKQKRSPNWYVRKIVPDDVVEIVGKTELWRSLKTTDKETAKRRARKVEAEFDLRIDRARAQRSPSSVDRVPDNALIRLARETFQAELAVYDDAINMQHNLEGLDMPISDLLAGLEYNSWDRADLDWVDERLRSAGFEVADGPGYWKAVHLLARAKLAALRTAQGQASGDWMYIAGDTLVTAAPSDIQVDPGLSVRDLIARFRNDPSRAHITEKSKQQHNTVLAILQEVAGKNTPATQVSREDCRRVREKLLERGLETSTINGYLAGLSALFAYAVREQYLPANPATGLRLRTGPHARDLKHPFSESQLRRIFTSADWRSAKTERPSLYWCPLLALYGGLRLTEAGQLLRDDIKQVDGVWVISVAPSETKRVKSRAGQRLVPVHPKLEALGFIEFVRSVNTERLFDDLPEPARGYQEALGKKFARLLRKLNADEERTGFHSFRHCFRDALREARVPEEIARALGGWASNGGTSSLYGAGHSVETLFEEISKIEPLVELDLAST